LKDWSGDLRGAHALFVRHERRGAALVQRQHLLDQGDHAPVARRIGGVGEVAGAIEIVHRARITGSR
jgi:hypothetical protein